MSKIELLAPGGTMDKLKMAYIYGADAVYISGKKFGLRSHAGNFSVEEIKEACEFAKSLYKRIYLTMNIIPHNDDFEGIEEYIKEVENAGIDAIIVADPGIFTIIRSVAPKMDIHISTQANNTNYRSFEFWGNLGAKRVVAARELSFKEISEIYLKTNGKVEIESFVHGAMCISFSGRCLLSNYFTNRDSNRGECSHPCRWKYSLIEEKRPNEYYPIEEDERGSYIFNSKDLCLIEYIPELINSGVRSFKIEGRMKSVYYVATVVATYRKAIDMVYKNPQYRPGEDFIEELRKVSHRDFTTGFYLDKNLENRQIYSSSSYLREYDFLGIVNSKIGEEYKLLVPNIEDDLYDVEQRNKISIGDEIEVLMPNGEYYSQIVEDMYDKDMNKIDNAPHAQMKVFITLKNNTPRYSMIRKKIQ